MSWICSTTSLNLGPEVAHSIRNFKREHAVRYYNLCRAASNQNKTLKFRLRRGRINKNINSIQLFILYVIFLVFCCWNFCLFIDFLFNSLVKIFILVLLFYVSSSGCKITHIHTKLATERHLASLYYHRG